MLPSLLLLPLLAFSFTTATHLRNKEAEMTEQAAISANMLREQTLTKRAPKPQAPPPSPAQPPPQTDPLSFVTKPNMVMPQFVSFLFNPPPPAAAQDEKRKRSLKKRREHSRPKAYHQKTNSLGGTSLVYDGENVQRSSVDKAVYS